MLQKYMIFKTDKPKIEKILLKYIIFVGFSLKVKIFAQNDV